LHVERPGERRNEPGGTGAGDRLPASESADGEREEYVHELHQPAGEYQQSDHDALPAGRFGEVLGEVAMLRISTGLAAGFVVGLMLLGDAAADTTTNSSTVTTTSTTTTTTLLPHPFPPATSSCIRQARVGRTACRLSGGTLCFIPYGIEYSSCFAAGDGVKCATKCETNQSNCLLKVPDTKRTCRAACATGLKADLSACQQIADGDNIWATGDASCL